MSIVKLDTSICNKFGRSLLLALLSSDRAIVHVLPTAKPSYPAANGLLRWATKRELKCRSLLVTASVADNFLDDYLCKRRTFENLHIQDVRDTNCTNFMVAAHCRNLCTIFFASYPLSKSLRSVLCAAHLWWRRSFAISCVCLPPPLNVCPVLPS